MGFCGKRICCITSNRCLSGTDRRREQNPTLRDLVKCCVSNSFFPEKDVSVTMVLPITIICRA